MIGVLSIAMPVSGSAKDSPDQIARVEAIVQRLYATNDFSAFHRNEIERIVVVRKLKHPGYSTEKRVFINERFARSASEGQLAFVIAHEMAHVFLEHNLGGTKSRTSRRANELSADHYAARFVANAGYDNDEAEALFRKQIGPWLLGLPFSAMNYPHPAKRIEIIRASARQRLHCEDHPHECNVDFAIQSLDPPEPAG